MRIDDLATHTFGAQKNNYELDDNLEEETLKLIMNP